MDITINSELDDPLPTDWLRDLADTSMRAERLPDSTQLSITLVSEPRMAELNARHMGKEGPTDVLSFPIEDFAAGIIDTGADGPPLMLGDVVICPAVVESNATTAGVAFEDELALMVVHGTLHLLGRDHVIDEEAEEMEQREREILAMVGRERP
ncbi:MAG: rRNA maturation RNase YbeY [Acidimicrobiia bacterium]|nr:rRNA maturation RNase YbeY [Acidimicrobiia bacterium]